MPVAIPVNALHFTMHTAMAYGSSYDVAVGTQPYGINLACTPSAATGTVSATVNSVAISCATGTPILTAIAGYFSDPIAVAVDAHGNLFVADIGHNTIKEMSYSNGIYGTPVTLGSGLNRPQGVAVNANGRLYVIDTIAICKFVW